MKKLGRLTFTNGWAGGDWKADDHLITIGDLPREVILQVGRGKVTARPILTNGTDYDHGHNYSWVAMDFELQLETKIGVVKKSLRELMGERKRALSIILFMES